MPIVDDCGELKEDYTNRNRPHRYKLEARTIQIININLSPGEGSERNRHSSSKNTDMVLYGKALLARRKAMYLRYLHNNQQPQKQGQQKSESKYAQDVVENKEKNKSDGIDHRNDENTIVSLLQGCGPPPYDYLLSTESG